MEPVDGTKHRQTTLSDDQSAAIQFLEGGAGRDATVERIDTHGALIFLIGQEAMKMKRAVKYDYMDLSTVEKRRALLKREYELNRDAAPSIYRGVLPLIRKADGSIAFGGSGEVLEWVLTMRRFPKEAELIHIAKHDGIGDDLTARLGAAVASYHAAAPVRPLDAHALIKEILDELDRVFDTMRTTVGQDAARFLAASRKMLSDRADHLGLRSLQGHVRRCHGDLHLRNIVMIEGVPTPIDALEFDERLGTCDTLYDLAFLLMDLDHLGMTHAANLVLNAYLSRATPDLSQTGLSLLPLYLSVRAAIRAMVDVQTAAVNDARKEMQADAKAYLAQALAYLAPPPPILVAIGGYSGTG
ncbi:kinase, partial [Puniceibacterium confluentis]